MLILLLSTALAKHPAAIDAFLDDPWTELANSGVPQGLQPVILSNIADGCARDGDAECVAKVVDVALDPRVSPWGASPANRRSFDGAGLYTAHVAMVLAAERDTGSEAHADLQRRMATSLYAQTMADGWHNPTSYAGNSSRWPADQAAVIYAIHRYSPSLAVHAFAEWRAVLDERGTDAATGLPVSELTGKYGYSETPRGCALMWTVGYLAPVAPGYAEALWTDASDVLMVWTPLGYGVREYPAGRDRAADGDSGPIVMGIGAAASAFAVGASKAAGDTDTHEALVASEARVRGWVSEVAPDEVDGLLAESIRYRWWGS